MTNNFSINLPQLLIVFIILLIIYTIFFSGSEGFENICMDYIPGYNYPTYTIKKNTIFVSVASYRDLECSDTINSLFDNADDPNRIYVGICQQNKNDSLKESCISEKNIKYINNISIHSIPHTEAKGPTYARYWCSTLWSGQEYYFQIDSHTKFVKGWDTIIINMLNECPNPDLSILSSYPPTESQLKLSGIPIMDSYKLNNGLPIFYAGVYEVDTRKPVKSYKPFIAAGYMFLKANFLHKVPFDPMLSGLFQGEEVLLSARFYTNGYDIYAPNIKICTHHYNREGSMFYKDVKDNSKCRSLAEKKVLFLLGLTDKSSVIDDFLKDYSRYGLGTNRTIENFWKDSGITYKDGKLVN